MLAGIAAAFWGDHAYGANAAYRNTVLFDSPLTYWEMDETAGTTAADSAGTPQNGTYENVTLGQASAFPNLGTCGSFNGSNSRVRVPFDASFNLGAGNFSVECWFKTTVTTRGDVYNFKGGGGDFGIFANQSGVGAIGGYHNGLLPSYVTTTNAWHHVVYVRSGTTLTLYVDGQSRATGTDTQQMSSSADIVIGANQTQIWFTGQIDEVAYYNTALSAARVVAHWDAAGQATPGAPTVVNAAATGITASTATVGGTVTDIGSEAPAVTLFWGAADGGTVAANWANSVPLGSQSGAFSTNLSGLAAKTTYFYRSRAVNASAESWAPSSATLQTLAAAPVVSNGSATNVLATSATLGAGVTSTGGEPPTVTIYYGATDGGTDTASWSASLSLGVQSGSATGNVSGLTQGTPYFFRTRAVNSGGTAWAGSAATFTTATATAPAVQNLAPTNVTGTSANLRGEVTATGEDPPTVTIYYGTTDGGSTAASWAASAPVLGAQTAAFAKLVTGLSPLTTYYFRCFAQNVGGSRWAASSQSFSTPAYVPPSVVINEIHYVEDNPTIHSEFIELYNAGAVPVDLSGWFFDSGITCTFPAGTTLAAGGYLVVCEDPAILQSKWGVSGAGVLSWQAGAPPEYGALSNGGETIVLRDAGGTKIDEVDYAQGFPWPTVGDPPNYSAELINPSLDNGLGGHWRSSKSATSAGPTPRAINSTYAANAPPATRQVAHRAVNPVVGQTWILSGQEVRITAKVTDPDGVQTVSLQYQLVEPGDYIKDDDARYNAPASWTAVAMQDDGQNGDVVAGDDEFSCLIPAAVQTHRRLVRYRITVTDPLGAFVRVPYADDPQFNFAYFVYDSVPAWTGSRRPGVAAPVTYSSSLLSSVPQYHLITRVTEHSNSQNVPITKADGTPNNPTAGAYGHSLYLWKGALCYDGIVYDHIRYRARGGVWRFAMGKNMWKFDFNKGHDFAARDNYGKRHDQKWKKMNFSAVIQQGDYNHRGEQGLFESVGFRLFQLTGMPAEHTQFVHFRVIERPDETNASAGQFDDDFQGLYLGIEQQDGQFLDEHGLPDGNLYKMEGGTGELNNQGPTQPSNKSDLNAFLSYGTTESWWRANCDLANYYNYRAIVDCIHHYDIGDGKNYFYYHNPVTNRWTVLPWDLDLIWSDNMYRADSGIEGLPPSGNSTEPFFSRIFGNGTTTGIPVLRLEHRNRMREVLDLLFNVEQTGMLIDEMASFIYQPNQPSFVDVDRAMWDYNPILISGFVNSGKAGHGRFYQSAVDNPATPISELQTFPGMMQKMRNYITTRRNVIVNQVLTSAEENLVPTTPVAALSAGGGGEVPTSALTFSSSGFVGKNGGTFSAMKWRLAEATEPGAAGYLPFDHTTRRLYEADPENTWESPEVTSFSATYTFPPVAARPGSTYRARVKHRDNTGRWSHWSAPVSFTAGQPDIALYRESLVVSQMMYNPAAPTPAEQSAAQDDDSFEWIELMNVGLVAIDLAPVRITKGIDFDFAGSAVTTLAPGARVVIVNKLAAFSARHAGQLAGVQIAGEWEDGDNLSNDGEMVRLSYGTGTTIREFTYDDAAPWPVDADAGYALVLINPAGLPDHNVGANWRSSIQPNGKPGIGDGTTFAIWAALHGLSDPMLDEDNDGLFDLAEYLLGGLPGADSQDVLPQASIETFLGADYLTYTFRRNFAADDVALTVQISDDLETWNSDAAHVVFVGATNHGDGTSTLVFRSATPRSTTNREFFRLLMCQR